MDHRHTGCGQPILSLEAWIAVKHKVVDIADNDSEIAKTKEEPKIPSPRVRKCINLKARWVWLSTNANSQSMASLEWYHHFVNGDLAIRIVKGPKFPLKRSH
jgi:hypothetical protein